MQRHLTAKEAKALAAKSGPNSALDVFEGALSLMSIPWRARGARYPLRSGVLIVLPAIERGNGVPDSVASWEEGCEEGSHSFLEQPHGHPLRMCCFPAVAPGPEGVWDVLCDVCRPSTTTRGRTERPWHGGRRQAASSDVHRCDPCCSYCRCVGERGWARARSGADDRRVERHYSDPRKAPVSRVERHNCDDLSDRVSDPRCGCYCPTVRSVPAAREAWPDDFTCRNPRCILGKRWRCDLPREFPALPKIAQHPKQRRVTAGSKSEYSK